MTTKYFAVLTNQGAALLANAAALGTKVNITSMAVGDGGGTLPTPDPAQTKLVGEKRRAQLNSLTIDTANSSQIIAEQIIPEGNGGFWIREIGLFDADGVMIAVANCAETYKPQLAEGSGRTQTVRMILIVNSTSAVTLKIDPAVVLATRQYVDNGGIEVRQYVDSVLAQHLTEKDPHSQYLKTSGALSEIAEANKTDDAVKNLKLREIFSGIAGNASNVKVNVMASSATATFTADEIIVEEPSGGRQFRVTGLNKTISLEKSGAGGMDVAAWNSGNEGFCAIYVIFNPVTGAAALLGVNATDTAAPVVYAGTKMPAGYTASALISVWRVTGSAAFRIGYQRGRKFSCPLTDVINTSSNPGGFTGVNLASCVPLNALTMTGYAYCNLGAGTAGVATLRIASDMNNCGFFQAFSGVGVSLGSDIYFELLLATPRTLFYDFAWSTSGASNAIIGVSGYTI